MMFQKLRNVLKDTKVMASFQSVFEFFFFKVLTDNIVWSRM